MSALDTQIAGSHYKDLNIQPMEYSMANKLDACQHTIIKYVTRFRAKGGIQDLEKARHCIDMLIEFERADSKPEPSEVFDEARMDVIGQNGNDGEHYKDADRPWLAHDGGACPALRDSTVDVLLLGALRPYIGIPANCAEWSSVEKWRLTNGN